MVEFLSYNSDILGTHLINRFDIITTHTISRFKNLYYLFHFGCHGNHMPVYLMANFLSKMMIFYQILSKFHKNRYRVMEGIIGRRVLSAVFILF